MTDPKRDRAFLVARLICGVIAISLLPLTLIVGVMLLRGPDASRLQGYSLLLGGGGALSILLLSVISPVRAAAALSPRIPRRTEVVRYAILALASAAVLVQVISLIRRAI